MSQEIKGRQKAFAEKVASGHSATEAYLQAGYRAAKRETAHRAASRLYANPGVRTYIRELRRTGDELAREETSLTIAKKLAFLARIVLTSSATLREDDPLIQSHRILKDGTTSIRIPCKLKALKMHSELAGHFLPEPQEQPIPTDSLQELFDQIRKGHLTDQPPQPAPTPKNAAALPTIAGRAGTSGDADSSPPNQQPIRPAAPPTNAPTLTKLEDSCHDSEGDMRRHSGFVHKNIGYPRPVAPSGAHISEDPSTKTTPTPQMEPEQNSRPQQTTTNPPATTNQPPPNNPPLQHSSLNIHKSPSPLRPVDIRRMVQAEIQATNALHQKQRIPYYEESPRPPVILR